MIFLIAGVFVLTIVVMIFLQARKAKTNSGSITSSSKWKVTPSLQEFLPIEEFTSTGAMVVAGKYRRMIRVGDINLFSMSLEEIRVGRDRFRDMLKRLEQPFQISVQARRANYTDFVKHSETVIDDAIRSYDNPVFGDYAESLKTYLRVEAQKPRTDRENLIVVGVLPKMGGETDKSQMERLDREQRYIEQGLTSMGLPYKVLEPVECVEAVQNFWNRERAVSQRYRDAFHNQTHAPRVIGAEVEVDDLVKIQTQAAATEEGL